MSEKRDPTLDFLRGLAIIGVVTVHVFGNFYPGIPAINFAAGLGVYGVQLFFFVSAMTMCQQWQRRRGESNAALKFYIRRFFRIAPPFWIAIAVFLTISKIHPIYAPNGETGIKQIITALLFIHPLWPDTIQPIVPGGWSIGVEMMFYAFFPLLVIRVDFDSKLYLLGALAIYIFNLAVVHPFYDAIYGNSNSETMSVFYYFEFFNQAPIFLLGIFLYKTIISGADRPTIIESILIFAAWMTLALSLKNVAGLKSASPYFWLLMFSMMAFIILAFHFRITLKPINRLGQLSYSIYLIHFAIIPPLRNCFEQWRLPYEGSSGFLLGMTTVLLTCFVLASFSEKLIEKPSIEIGRKIISRIRTIHPVSV